VACVGLWLVAGEGATATLSMLSAVRGLVWVVGGGGAEGEERVPVGDIGGRCLVSVWVPPAACGAISIYYMYTIYTIIYRDRVTPDPRRLLDWAHSSFLPPAPPRAARALIFFKLLGCRLINTYTHILTRG